MKLKWIVMCLFTSIIFLNNIYVKEVAAEIDWAIMIKEPSELSTFLHMSDSTIKGIVYDVFSGKIEDVYYKNGWNFETIEYKIDEYSGSLIIGKITDHTYGFTIDQVFKYCVMNNMIRIENDIDYLIDNYSTYSPLINDIDKLVFVDNYTLLEGPDGTLLVSRNTVNKVNDQIGNDWTRIILIICAIVIILFIIIALFRRTKR